MIDLDRVDLLAKIENVLEIPGNERLTRWFGDYGIWESKPDITQEDIDKRIEELDSQLDHKKTVYIGVRETLRRVIPVDNPKSIQEAIDIVSDMYKNKEKILDADDYEDVFVEPSDMDFDMEM